MTVEQVATDLGVHPMTLWKWMRRADIDDGTKHGTTGQENLPGQPLMERVRQAVRQGHEGRPACARRPRPP
ncbi:hypothetical protein [Streptomyces sp. SAI-117]|uniref:hypothetical protein n=1 Tax=Streptomyces sp. SAI-117 TaxID=2940546 RepID=UPI0032AF0CD2